MTNYGPKLWAIRLFTGPTTSWAGSFGDPGWRRTYGSLCQPVQYAPATRVLLRPLPFPSQPWSHISLDFVTGLPASEGNTVVLVIVDRFLKAAHCIPLPRLPAAPETAWLVVDHSLPLDVVSDRGPQYTARFWLTFCSLNKPIVRVPP